MNRVLEKFLIAIVTLLLFIIIALIVKYNMKEEKIEVPYSYGESLNNEINKKDKKSNYLEDLENYSDVDVDVDPKRKNSSNIIEVTSESRKNDLTEVIDDKSKSSYMENLEKYANDDSSESESQSLNEDPLKPEKEEIEDKVGMAIDNALSDI